MLAITKLVADTNVVPSALAALSAPAAQSMLAPDAQLGALAATVAPSVLAAQSTLAQQAQLAALATTDTPSAFAAQSVLEP